MTWRDRGRQLVSQQAMARQNTNRQ
jgi:hypothetical protein